jgi:hypothetical protein
MKAILVHGMGRTPLSLMLLARRLHSRGFLVEQFGYSATFQSFASCVDRLVSRARQVVGQEPFILVSHSLGAVLIRAALPALAPLSPVACFFLAPPSRASKAARFFAKSRLLRAFTGEMGLLLADETFMGALPVPTVPVRSYAGTAGFRGRLSPFGHELNDGVLAVSETALGPDQPVISVPAVHTFIMNAAAVADDIQDTVSALLAPVVVKATQGRA